MAKKTPPPARPSSDDLFALKPEKDCQCEIDAQLHRVGKKFICRTDYRHQPRNPLSLVVDATDGFIPLWEQNMVLHWRFNAASLAQFAKPEEIKQRTRGLLAKGIAAWGDAVPIRFAERTDNTDFEIVVQAADSCNMGSCTLAQAFFPDAGRHQLLVFPMMFTQVEKEQVDTIAHELGHIFGLRHFFAPQTETTWPSQVFGEHRPFSIMNYGANSEMTAADRRDLKLLYTSVWNGTLKDINGTPIKQVRPYHYFSA